MTYPQQSHCVRHPALDMFCITLCGPRTKKFGDPCANVLDASYCVTCPFTACFAHPLAVFSMIFCCTWVPVFLCTHYF